MHILFFFKFFANRKPYAVNLWLKIVTETDAITGVLFYYLALITYGFVYWCTLYLQNSATTLYPRLVMGSDNCLFYNPVSAITSAVGSYRVLEKKRKYVLAFNVRRGNIAP